jgi:hypothetical protein
MFLRKRGQFSAGKVLLLAASLLLAGCGSATPTSGGRSVPPLPLPEQQPTPIVLTHVGVATPITVKLTLSKAPRLNEPADVTLEVMTVADAPGTRAEILLPPGTQVASGSAKWSGDLKAGQPVTLKATIQFTQGGDLTVEGKALSPQPNGDTWGDSLSIYLHVTEQAGTVGFGKQPNPNLPKAGDSTLTPPAASP